MNHSLEKSDRFYPGQLRELAYELIVRWNSFGSRHTMYLPALIRLRQGVSVEIVLRALLFSEGEDGGRKDTQLL